MNTLRFARLASGLLALGAALDLSAQVVFTANGTYNQNFDTIPFDTSAQLTWVDNSTLAGWYVSDHSYGSREGIGSIGATNLFVYSAATGSSDLALGSHTAMATPSPVFYGVQLLNNTGHALDSVSFSFSVENYRSGAWAEDVLNATFGFNNTGLELGAWNTLASLNASSGNVTLSLPLTWNDGDSLWIRWEDTVLSAGTTTKNAGFAIDNFSVTAIPEPSTYALILGVATLGLVGFRRWRAQR